MILLIDNYDSFTYNIVQYLGDLDTESEVVRNDQITVDEAIAKKPKGIIISPGPSDPDHAGICLDVVKACAENEIPLFGICLGHQSIGQAFGGKIVKTEPMHGKRSFIMHNDTGVFENLASPMEVARYHSLIIEKESLPEYLEITAEIGDIIMGVAHKTLPIHGVQFHPESIATEKGHTIFKNFLRML